MAKQKKKQQKKLPKSRWSGFRFPMRDLTPFEIDVFSTPCDLCDMEAVVTEKQGILEPGDEKRPIEDFEDETLKFYCQRHAPGAGGAAGAEEAAREAAEDANLFARMAVPVWCPKYEHQRFVHNCLTYGPTCLRRCPPIKGLLSTLDLSFPDATKICWAARRQKETKKTG